MANQPLPTVEQLSQLLAYDPDTGVLTWMERAPHWFEDGHRSGEWRAKNWNSKLAGKEAGYVAPYGYRLVQLPGRMECAHRIIWAMIHGEWPEFIDHINGNRADNRLSNLRSVSRTENNRNMAKSKSNKSGVTGVSWYGGKWVAEISHQAKKVVLGRFSELSDAAAARKEAEIKYGYHENHGR